MRIHFSFFDKEGTALAIPCKSFDTAMSIARNRRNLKRVEKRDEDHRILGIWDIERDSVTGRSISITERKCDV